MKFHFLLTLLLMTTLTASETLMAKKDKLIFHDDMNLDRGKTKKTTINDDWFLRSNMGVWTKKNNYWQSSWKPGIGHTPVMAYVGKFKNAIIEVQFRYNKMNLDWHTQCFRIALDNKDLYTGHILSAWANPNNDFIETGFLLQHISKKADKTIISDLLFDKQPLKHKVGQWHTAILEVVNDEAIFHMDGNLAYAKSEKLNVDKALISLTLGKTLHDIKSVKVWSASLKENWPDNKNKVINKRQPFTPQKHNYSKTKK